MAYTPYEWTVNSYLNPTRMNAIEQGIAAASQAAESASGEFHTIEELIGTQSIAGIGDGTLTGATWKINNDLSDLKNTVTTLNSKLNYSKSETLIGNFDGVPLYRKVVINNDTGERTVELGVNASKIKKVYVECVTSLTTTIPYYMSSTDYWNFYLTGTTLVYRGSNSFRQTNTLIIVIEYIK